MAGDKDVGKWRSALVHSVRTAVAAVVSVLTARLFHLPETYWAAITTMVVMQSSLGAALTVSWQRFVGTALGSTVGAIAATYFEPHVLVLGASVLMLGLVCTAIKADRSAYRFGGIALAIVFLVPRRGPAWQIALHRFTEVSIGIVVALFLTLLWPEPDSPITPARQML